MSRDTDGLIPAGSSAFVKHRRNMTIGLILGSLIVGWSFANPYFNPALGNFLGALCVAIGGLLGSLHSYAGGANSKAASWSFIVIGGAAIAGSAFQGLGLWT